MKRIASLILTGLAVSAAAAGNLTEENTGKAREIIAAAIEAHGGDALLEDLKTLVVENRALNYSVDQSRAAEPPWDSFESEGLDAIDLENSIYVNRFAGTAGGFEGDTVTIINGDDSLQIDLRAGTAAPIAEPDYATTSGPFVRVTPALLVRTLKEREDNAYYLGEATLDDRKHRVVGFSMAVGPAITLYFDAATNLLHKSERVLPNFGLVEYVFDDYETVDGLAVNRDFTFYLNGDVNFERKNATVHVNAPLEPHLEVNPALAAIPAVEPDPLTRQEIAQGVWLIGGTGTYAMFVDMGDYILAAGGTAGIPERIESLREVVGDKPLRYGMLTHHHFDHVLGVRAYEEEGATIIASKAHERVVRSAAADGEALEVKTVGRKMTLEGDRRVEIIDIGPTAHSEHLLVAWLPEERILFEADHFALPTNGTVPPAVSSTRSFADALARLDLDVERIASAHSPRIGTPDDLRAALAAEVFAERRAAAD